ncbi:MAG: hypothetical protein MJ146_02120 [Clostridia bacterium]|nr:hypothetical protein [Clostridia bacterium]
MRRKILVILLALCVTFSFTGMSFADTGASQYADQSFYGNFEQALDYAKDKLINKSGSFQVFYYTDDENFLKNNNRKTMEAELFKHTGKGNEGDYLYLSMKDGFSCGIDPVLFTKDMVGGGGLPPASDFNGYKYMVIMTFYTSYYLTKDQEDAVTSKLKEAEKSLNLAGLSDYEKVEKIYTYVTDNVKYGGNSDLQFTSYGAAVDNLAVCEGFATLLYRMLLDQGIDARIITSEDKNHAWNIVRLGNAYYYLDSTWDRTEKYDKVSRNYFLKGKSDFTDHECTDSQYADEDFQKKYPLANAAYNKENPEEAAHFLSDWKVVTKPTCVLSGVEKRTCDCGYSEERVIPALDHTVKHVEAKAATTKATGNKEYYYCEDCDKYFLDANCTKETTLSDVTIAKLISKSQKITTKKISTYKASNLKKKAKTFSLGAKAKGKLTYKVTVGKSKNITVSKAGKVTLKKGCKKGAYKVKISAASLKSGKYYYKATSKTVTIKVK